MDFFILWDKNKKDGCLCKWCHGDWEASKTFGNANWSVVRWNATGDIITESEARCQLDLKDPITNIKTGYFCSGHCKEYNEYAAANQPDGKFICFRCR